MNNKLFSTSPALAKADTMNNAGGKAYSMSAEHSLAQYAVTSTFNGTYYISAKEDLDKVIELARQVEPLFLAQVAIYARRHGHMKDTPAVLLAVLATLDSKLFRIAFPQVVNNGRMLRNFVQVMRSGVVGRKSLGSAPRKMVRQWLDNVDDDYLFRQTVGNSPSMADIIKMVHPKPQGATREMLYSYIIGGKYKLKKLPKLVRSFEKFKTASKEERKMPSVPFQMLSSYDLGALEWRALALEGSWQFVRMNLNNFAKFGLFKDDEFTQAIAAKLSDAELVKRSKNFPFQLYQAYRSASPEVPQAVRIALQQALEASVASVPVLRSSVSVGLDVSGSMGQGVTGGYSRNPVTCSEAGGLLAGSIAKTNAAQTSLYLFDTECREATYNPLDSLISITEGITRLGGGTDCSTFLSLLNKQQKQDEVVILVSDNESWHAQRGERRHYNEGTAFLTEWKKYKRRVPNALLVCIDIVPGTTAQAVGPDVLLVGGFSDSVFNVISRFVEARGDHTFWAEHIKKEIQIKEPAERKPGIRKAAKSNKKRKK